MQVMHANRSLQYIVSPRNVTSLGEHLLTMPIARVT